LVTSRGEHYEEVVSAVEANGHDRSPDIQVGLAASRDCLISLETLHIRRCRRRPACDPLDRKVRSPVLIAFRRVAPAFLEGAKSVADTSLTFLESLHVPGIEIAVVEEFEISG
jgi:hypothetical protein